MVEIQVKHAGDERVGFARQARLFLSFLCRVSVWSQCLVSWFSTLAQWCNAYEVGREWLGI